jgi:hypothetical protein
MSDAPDDLALRLNVKFRDGTAPMLQAELLRLPGRQRVKRLLELASLGLMAERGMSVEGFARPSAGLIAPKLDAGPLRAGEAPGDLPAEDLPKPPLPSQEVGRIPVAVVVETGEAGALPDLQQRGEELSSVSPRPRRRPSFNVDLTG